MIVGCDCCTQVYLLTKETIHSNSSLVCSINNFVYVKLLHPLYQIINEPNQENSCRNAFVVYRNACDKEVG